MKFNLFKKRVQGRVVDLVPTMSFQGDPDNGFSPTFCFNICLHDSFEIVGRCDLRVGSNREIYYLGNIGYHVDEAYRGNHYAYYACLLLFEVAKEKYGMEKLIITCNPDNVASRKTCEKLQGQLLEIAKVPVDHYCYRVGDKEKCIFNYYL